jgi:putative transposase
MKKAPNGHKGSVAKICGRFGLKRDSYYKFQRRNKKSIETTNKVISLVKERRKEQSREGGRKLHEALIVDFIMYGLKVGRDMLFEILRDNHMLVYRKRSGARTTNSYHHFHKYNTTHMP